MVPKLSNGDWLTRFLDQIRLGPIGVVLSLSIINVVINISIALNQDAWFPSMKSQGLGSEPGAWFNDFLVIPVVIGYFRWIQTAGDSLFGELVTVQVFSNPNFTKSILNNCKTRFQGVWTVITSVSIAVIFCVWFVLTFTVFAKNTFSSWVTVSPTIVWIRVPFLFVAAYAITMFVIDLAMIILVLNALFRNQEIVVQPFSPDDAGGLGSVGQFVAKLGYLIGMLGLGLSANFVTQNAFRLIGISDYVAVIALILYLVLSPIFFFLPLWSAHVAMVKYRNNLLTNISKEYVQVFNQLISLRAENPDRLEPHLRKIKQLEETQKTINKFPIWPFNADAPRRFFALVISPLIPAVISVAIDLIKRMSSTIFP
ncbi:MAG: hypothetical protein HY868_13105 [Chloroflexi bacterium]|nr:hypothetical protein [Chloroflexota bacterium]